MDLEALTFAIYAGVYVSTVYLFSNIAVAELNKVIIDSHYFGKLTPEEQSRVGKPSRREIYSQAFRNFPRQLYNDFKKSKDPFVLPILNNYKARYEDAFFRGETKLQKELRDFANTLF